MVEYFFGNIFDKTFFFKIICIFFQKYFWWKYFWWKYFWWKYFWQKYFLWIYFWPFHLVTKGFPFSHQGSTPPYTSFWSEVWLTDALSVPFIVLDGEAVWRCGRVAGSVEVDVARWSHCIVYKYLGTAFYPLTSSAGRLHVMSITYHQETLIWAKLNIWRFKIWMQHKSLLQLCIDCSK